MPGRFVPVALIAVLWIVFSVAHGQTTDRTIYVDNNHPAASDHNAGSADRPLRTIQAAMNRAVENKRFSKLSTKVIVNPGIYRESVDFGYTNYPTNDPGNSARMIVEAATPGSVIVTGAEVWTDWVQQGNLYTHEWPYDWGVTPKTQADAEDIVFRKEMIFVDGQLLRQVLAVGSLKPGTFFVDEKSDRIHVYPPAGVNMATARVEVGTREFVWRQFWENNVTLRGLVIQQAAASFGHTTQAVASFTESDNLLIEDCRFEWSNWNGLYINNADHVVVRRTKMNHNGGNGWNTWHVRDITFEDTETSFNNWRGHMGGWTGWDVGNKLLAVHGLTIRRHRATDNLARGLWLDYDIENAILEEVTIANNLSDGLWIEANQGPITIRNSTIQKNQEAGILGAYSEQVTIEHSVIADNRVAQILLTNKGGRPVENFETGKTTLRYLKNWTLRTNNISGNSPLVSTFSHDATDFDLWKSTLRSDGNTWWNPTRRDAWEILGSRWDFARWKTSTGQDLHSRYADPARQAGMMLPARTGGISRTSVASSLIKTGMPLYLR